MGNVIVSIGITLDGFVDAERVSVDPEFFEFTHALMAGTKLGAFGRHTFEIFQERWPQRLKDPHTSEWMRRMAQALHDLPKVVFSSTLNTTTWNNSTIVSKLEADYISAFKRESSGALTTFGSPGLVESLTAMNVVDDYYFNVQPAIAGKGDARFFSKLNLPSALGLKFIDCKQLASGVLIVHYKNIDADTTR